LRYPQYHNDYFPNIRRAEEASRVMELAFREFRSYPVLKANQVVGTVPVLNGKQPSVQARVTKPLNVTMQVDSHAGMKTVVKPDQGLKAPVQAGQKVGVLMITAPEFPAMTVPLYAAQPVAEVGMFGSLWQSLQRMWKK
jgi:D-alanyl-D-alanine carboxypeptidase (penicillin-binding protein 5/6)